MRSLLREAGYGKLDVTERLDGVAVSGRIASDSERSDVLKIAQGLDFPVYLNLAVHSDTADAVRASYNAMALYPEVTEQPAPNPGISVRGYIRDAVLEEQALDAARRNVPILTKAEGPAGTALSVHSHIRHMEDIQDILEPALAARRLRSSVSVDYLPGRVLIRGALSPKSKEALRETAGEIQQKLGIPIPFDIINTADAARLEETPGQSPEGQPRQPAQQTSQAKPRMGFKVTSVSMGPMKYLILDSGERVFEGAELPGGYILEGIGVDKLILIKNNVKTSYPLKGGAD